MYGPEADRLVAVQEYLVVVRLVWRGKLPQAEATLHRLFASESKSVDILRHRLLAVPLYVPPALPDELFPGWTAACSSDRQASP